MLQVQRRVPIDDFRPQVYVPPSLLHRGRKYELGLEDEELEPKVVSVGASIRWEGLCGEPRVASYKG